MNHSPRPPLLALSTLLALLVLGPGCVVPPTIAVRTARLSPPPPPSTQYQEEAPPTYTQVESQDAPAQGTPVSYQAPPSAPPQSAPLQSGPPQSAPLQSGPPQSAPPQSAAADLAPSTKARRNARHLCPEFGRDAGGSYRTATDIGFGSFQGCLTSNDRDAFIVQVKKGRDVRFSFRHRSENTGYNDLSVVITNVTSAKSGRLELDPFAAKTVTYHFDHDAELYIRLSSIEGLLYEVDIEEQVAKVATK